MSTSAPRATLVVPSYNQGRYLSPCLRSLVAQAGPVETLIFDNVSTDETPSVLHQFASVLTQIIVKADGGQSEAINRGFRAARGDVIGWLNSDDVLMPGALDQAIQALKETGADVVYGHCAYLDAAGATTGYFPYTRSFEAHELRNFSDFIPQPATFFRRSLLQRVGFLDERLHYAMDWDLWCRFAAVGARFEFVPRIWAGARIHDAAKTSRGGTRRLWEVWRVNSRHRTLPVPMLPILYLAYKANRSLPLARWLPFLRPAWRRLTGGDRSSTVNGVAGATIVAIPARLHYPVYERLQRVAIDIADADYAPALITLNGRPMTRRGESYQSVLSDQEITEAVDIQISRVSCPLPTTFHVSHTTSPG